MSLTRENSVVLARLALVEFGYDPETVDLQFVKMRENTVFRAETPDGSIALRLHRPGYRTHEEVKAESDFIDLLSREGFPVVHLVEAANGHRAVTVSDGETEVIVDAQRWLENSRQLGQTEGAEEASPLLPEHFETMGALAARMHNVAERLGGAGKFPRVPWDCEAIIGPDALWGDALSAPGLDAGATEQLQRAREIMRDQFKAFGTEPSVYGVIHADFTPENVLVSGDEFVVIDFDDFGDGWYLFDLSTVLFFFVENELYPDYRESLLRGYRAERDLSQHEEQLLDLFLLARGFTYLGWAATRPETETAQFLIAEIVPLVVRMATALGAE